MSSRILVVGATGGVGQHVVKKLLRDGHLVRTLVRDEEKAKAMFGDDVEIAVGDVRRPDQLVDAFGNVDRVVCTVSSTEPEGDNSPEHVDFEGVYNLVQAADDAHVQHFVLVSSIGVSQPDHPLNSYGRVLRWKLRGENMLRTSGMNHTIVRPGGLTDEPGNQQAVKVDQGDNLKGKISREDVAEACVQALHYPERTRKLTFEIVNADGDAPQDWGRIFDTLEREPIVGGDADVEVARRYL